MSIFLGAKLEDAFERLVTGEGVETKSGELTLGTDALPTLPMDSGDRNRTSPFAFTGNKFEFRALGSSMSLGFTNAVLNTTVAEAIDELAAALKEKLGGGDGDVFAAVAEVVKDVWQENKQIVFNGDGYSEEWHAEAERRGLVNLRTTPDALPSVVSEQTVKAFGAYNVLSERELHSRFEVWTEQYTTKLNIEAETAATMARTQILPAALRYAEVLDDGGDGAGVKRLQAELDGLLDELIEAIFALEAANEDPGKEGLELAEYMRDVRDPGDGRGPRARRPPGADRRRRPVAAAEVLRDALHQVAPREGRSARGVIPDPPIAAIGAHAGPDRRMTARRRAHGQGLPPGRPGPAPRDLGVRSRGDPLLRRGRGAGTLGPDRVSARARPMTFRTYLPFATAAIAAAALSVVEGAVGGSPDAAPSAAAQHAKAPAR
jgi:hypothetical protein